MLKTWEHYHHVCDAFKVPCIDTHEMLDRLGGDFKPSEQKKRK